MARKNVEDLKALRAELIVRRRKEAYWLAAQGPLGDERIAKLTHVHLAIEAVDQVIEEGEEEPETHVPGFDRSL
jgi:hypothetical protein